MNGNFFWISLFAFSLQCFSQKFCSFFQKNRGSTRKWHNDLEKLKNFSKCFGCFEKLTKLNFQFSLKMHPSWLYLRRDNTFHYIKMVANCVKSNLSWLSDIMKQFDLFGNEVIKDQLLRDKFTEPPFTILDAKQGNL